MKPDPVQALELVEQGRALYARVKAFPETAHDREKFTLRPDAFLAFLDMREAMPRILDALEALARDRAGWIEK